MIIFVLTTAFFVCDESWVSLRGDDWYFSRVLLPVPVETSVHPTWDVKGTLNFGAGGDSSWDGGDRNL